METEQIQLPDLSVRAFDPVSDAKHVGSWLSSRNMNGEMSNNLPKLGFMVYSPSDLICAGFLRMCEGNSAILDSLVTNPLIAPEIRDKSIDLVVTRLIEEAKNLNLDGLIAYSVDYNTLMRSIRFGFVQQPQTVISLALSSPRS